MGHYMWTYGKYGWRASTNNSTNAVQTGPSSGYLRLRSDGTDLHGEYSTDNITWTTLYTWTGKGSSVPTLAYIASETSGGGFSTEGYCDWMTVVDVGDGVSSGDPVYRDPTGEPVS